MSKPKLQLLNFRATPEFISKLDSWMVTAATRSQPGVRLFNRSETIRRLVDAGIDSERAGRVVPARADRAKRQSKGR